MSIAKGHTCLEVPLADEFILEELKMSALQMYRWEHDQPGGVFSRHPRPARVQCLHMIVNMLQTCELMRSVPLAQVSDTGVFALQALTGLQRLTLAGCSGVGNGAVGALAKITSLQHLDLHWCSFGDKGEPSLQNECDPAGLVVYGTQPRPGP